MTQPTLQQSIDQIVTALQQRPERQMKGALLGEQVKKVAPSLDLRKLMNVPAGPGALSKFVEKYLSAVLVRSGTSGSDVVYEIVAGERKGDYGHLLWLTFARPGSEQILSLDVSNGVERATLSVSAALSPNHVQIDSATLSELDTIRINFTEQINLSLADDTPPLNASTPYSEWSRQLKLIDTAQYKKWAAYRISKIVELFHERLTKLNVPLERRNILDVELKKSQRHIHSPSATAQASNPPEKPQPAQVSSDFGDRDFRAAILEVVRNLPDSDLRLLRLPAGAIFDALRHAQSKN